MKLQKKCLSAPKSTHLIHSLDFSKAKMTVNHQLAFDDKKLINVITNIIYQLMLSLINLLQKICQPAPSKTQDDFERDQGLYQNKSFF